MTTTQPQQMTRAAWRAAWRAAEYERRVREALAAGNTLQALAIACAAARSEVKHRARHNRRAGQLIAVRLAAMLLATAAGIPDATPPGPRAELTPELLLGEFGRALTAAAQQEGTRR